MRIPDNTGLVQDPFHLGAVILDKIIGDIKSKLPFLKKKKGGEDDLDEEDEDSTGTETEVSGVDDDAGEKTTVNKPNLKSSKSVDDEEETSDEVTEDNSLVGKIKAKLNSLKKKDSSEDELEETDDGEEKAKKISKKKPNLIVIAGAVGLIGFVILSDFGEETPSPEVATDTPAPKKKPKKNVEQPTEEKPVEEKPAEEKPVDATATTAPDTTTTTAPDTTVTTAPDTTTTTAPDTTVTTAPDTTTTTAPDTTVTTAPDTTTTTAPDTTVTTAPDTTVTTEPDTTTTMTTETPVAPDNSTVDSVTGDETTPTPDNLTEQILKDLEDQAAPSEKKTVRTEYVTPPNYENVGRGLVYNCSGQHWACVDAPSYKTCEDNSSSTKYLKKKAECYPFNVYETQSGCEKMQNRMVSSSAKTEFCTE